MAVSAKIKKLREKLKAAKAVEKKLVAEHKAIDKQHDKISDAVAKAENIRIDLEIRLNSDTAGDDNVRFSC